jgi:hypothetical protein
MAPKKGKSKPPRTEADEVAARADRLRQLLTAESAAVELLNEFAGLIAQFNLTMGRVGRIKYLLQATPARKLH